MVNAIAAIFWLLFAGTVIFGLCGAFLGSPAFGNAAAVCALSMFVPGIIWALLRSRF